MSRMTHSSSLKSHKFLTQENQKAGTSVAAHSTGDFNFGDNINQWKKYHEVDEFVSIAETLIHFLAVESQR